MTYNRPLPFFEVFMNVIKTLLSLKNCNMNSIQEKKMETNFFFKLLFVTM